MEHIVYLTTNKINGTKYVGKHTSKDLSKDNYIGSGILIQRAIKKYGRNNFDFKILGKYKSEEEAFVYEKYFVNFYNTLNNGYNLKEGGRGGLVGYVLSKETIEKKRNGMIGKNNWKNNGMYGMGEKYDVYDNKNHNLIESGLYSIDVALKFGLKVKYTKRYAKAGYSFNKDKYRITIHNEKPIFDDKIFLLFDVYDIVKNRKILSSATREKISLKLGVGKKSILKNAKHDYKIKERYHITFAKKFKNINDLKKEIQNHYCKKNKTLSLTDDDSRKITIFS